MSDPEQQWVAASTLVAGVVQRLGTPHVVGVHPALTLVHPGDLVQVELMMIHAACQRLHAAGTPLTHESVLAEIRSSEPGGEFGFACAVFEELWQRRATRAVSDAEFGQAVATLTFSADESPVATDR